MLKLRTPLLVLALASATTGCTVYGRAGGPVVASADPILVELYPGVWVIEDYDEPVFYADGFYWWYRDDGWYRSGDHTGGWIHVRSAPSGIARIDRPRAYVRYRAEAGVRVRSGPRGEVIVRDHRNAPRAEPQRSRDETRRPGPDDRARPPVHSQPQPDRREPDRDQPAARHDRADRGKPNPGEGKGKSKDEDKGKGKADDKHPRPRHP